MDRVLKVFLKFLCKLRFTRGTQFDWREQAAAASASCIPGSARRPRTRHVSNATHPAPLTTVTPSPGHLTAAPHPGYASPSRSPSPREQLLPSIPPSNPGHRRRQSSNVAVAIESPSTGSLTLIPPTNPPPLTEDPYSIGSSTAHSSLTSGAPHLQSPQLSTGTASTQPNSDLPTKPMNPDQVPRYTRRNTVSRKGTDYEIPALTMTFRPEQGPEDDCAPWVSATHPDGALYFYDSARMLFTDTDMHDPLLRNEIEARFLSLQDRLPADGSLPKNYDLVLDKHEEGGQMQWFYYYAHHDTRCLFWLEPYAARDMLSEVYWVGSPAHVKHRLEALYWSHWSLYPVFFEGRRLECEIYDELVGILSHGCVDVMTSKSSTLPYDDDTMKKMLELVRSAKESDSDSNSSSMYHTAAVSE
ncbi:hypothetical protein EDB85DRAFT_176673 [Lactarius pseudohatsudake]|nr:hypothetical protein EDB85DRAFT_176673 [Lactarius pseudohatsudake]